jgi:hypothetical protein
MLSGLRLLIRRKNSSDVNGSRSASLGAFGKKRASTHNFKLRIGSPPSVLLKASSGPECL